MYSNFNYAEDLFIFVFVAQLSRGTDAKKSISMAAYMHYN